MGNKRKFKKYAENVGLSICDEMLYSYYNVKGADQAKIEAAAVKVLRAVDAAKDNANIYFDKGVKAFESHEAYKKAKNEFFKALFNKIKNDLADAIDEALKEFNAAIPEEEKAKNKAFADA